LAIVKYYEKTRKKLAFYVMLIIIMMFE